jgi:hypothetical protein
MTGRYGAHLDGQDNQGSGAVVHNDQTGRRLLEQVDNPGTTATDATTNAQSIHQTEQQFFALLKTASSAVHTDWNTAKTSYDQAIQSAKSIDQTQVATLIQAVNQQLQTEQDPAKQKLLAQEALDLDALQRAVGIATANKGLAEKRLGLDAAGTRDLMQAAAVDPKMLADANFQKHFRDAEAEEAQVTGRQDLSLQDLQAANNGTGGPGADNGAGGGSNSGADNGAGGGSNSGAGGGSDAGAGGTNNGVGGGTDGGAGRTNTGATDATITDLMSRRQFTDATGAVVALPQEWPQYSAVQQAEYLKSKCTRGTALSDDEKKLFKEIIYRADTVPSTRKDQLINGRPDGLKAIVNAENQALGTAGTQQLTTLGTSIKNELATITDPQKKALATALLGQYVSAWKDEQLDGFRTQLSAIDPKLSDLLTQQDKVIKDAGIWTQYLSAHNIKRQIANEDNQSAVTRATYAGALAVDGNANDRTEAQTWIKNALSHNINPDFAPLCKNIASHDLGMTDADVKALPDTGVAPTSTDTQNETGIAVPARSVDNSGGSTTTTTTFDNLNPQALADAIRNTSQKADAITDKVAALTQLKSEYETNTQKADAMLSATMDGAAQKITDWQKQMPPAQLATLNQNMQTAVNAFNPKADATDKQNFATLLNAAAAPADQAAAKAALQAKYPDLVASVGAYQAAVAPVVTVLKIVRLAQGLDFAAHESYAKALSDGGQADPAKAELTKAFQALSVQDRTAIMADTTNGKPVTDLVTKLQLDVSKIPPPTISPALTTALNGMGGGAPGAGGAGGDGSGGAGGDGGAAGGGANGGVGPEVAQRKADSDALKASWDAAVADLGKTNNFAQSKQKFEDMIKQADQMLAKPEYSTDHINQLVADLKSGKTTDATTHQQRDLTPDEIINMNLQAVAAIAARATVENYHVQYADVLVRNNQWVDATAQWKAASTVADGFPVAAAKQEIANLQAAGNNPALPANATDATKGLPAYINALNATMDAQPQIYLGNAAFLLSGGKNDRGIPNNPSSPVLDPAGSKALIDRALAKQREINGGQAGSANDSVNDTKFRTQVDAGVALVKANAKGALLADIAKSDDVWKKPVTSFAAGATGVAVTIGLLAITRGESRALLEPLASSKGLFADITGKLLTFGEGTENFLNKAGPLAGAARWTTAVVPGAGLATLGNMGLQGMVGSHQPGNLSDAAYRGFGSYVATGSLLATKEGLSNTFFKGVTAENVARNAMDIMSEGGTKTVLLSDLDALFKKRQYSMPQALKADLATSDRALTDADLQVAFGGNQRGMQLFNSVFKDQLRDMRITAAKGGPNNLPTDLLTPGATWRRNFVVGYGSLMSYSLANTLTEGIAASNADGKNHVGEALSNTYLPGARQNGESLSHYVFATAVSNPIVADAFFAQVFALPKAPPSLAWNSWSEMLKAPAEGFKPLEPAITHPIIRPLVPAINGTMGAINPALQQVQRYSRWVTYPLATAGNYVNPRGTFNELTAFQQMRAGIYLPFIAGEGYDLVGGGVNWAAQADQRKLDRSLLNKIATPPTNGAIPTDGSGTHADVSPPTRSTASTTTPAGGQTTRVGDTRTAQTTPPNGGNTL